MNSLRSTAGESLLEVIIALGVIMIVAGPVGGLFIASRNASHVERTDVIATRLADEGLEVMRNFRDTNLLRFSTRESLCWNTEIDYTDARDCENHRIVGDRSYTLEVELDGQSPRYLQWQLGPQAVALHENLRGDHDDVYKLALNEATGVYHHALNVAGEQETIFHREIAVQYFDMVGEPGSLTPLTPDGTDDTMLVVSNVRYRTGPSVRSVSRSLVLTKYSR